MRKSALYLLGLVVAALVALGLVVLFSASEVRSLRLSGTPWQFVAKQSGYIIAGLVLASVVALIDYHRWRDQWLLTALLAFFVFAALWVVFAFPAVKGSHRWIPLPGGVNFQPGEVAKIVMVLALSVVLDKAGWRVELFKRGALYPAVVIGFFVSLIVFKNVPLYDSFKAGWAPPWIASVLGIISGVAARWIFALVSIIV